MRKNSCWVLLLLMACHSPGEKEMPAKTAEPEPVAFDGVVNHPDTIPYNVQIDTVIHLSLDSVQTATAKGAISKTKSQVYCFLSVKKKQTIRARLIPATDDLNIRFSQLIFPDKTTDGPFGRELVYPVRQPGTYQLVISPNRMASGPFNGDFELKVSLTESSRK
ncbi:MAG: hypothetical protein J0H92_14235 [Sphingobacteriales bacterium]|nr:hypothetical protein [Sphingobacteriales bacterium]